MASGGEKLPNRYYYVLGLSHNASACAIRNAYRKLAMKWHPDKCSSQDQAEAKVKFQEIQEAYAVLSDGRKKMLYDNGLYNLDDDDDDIEGLSDFISELSGMMTDVQASEEAGKGSSFEELQQLFVSMFSADLAAFNDPNPPPATSINFDKKQGRGGGLYDVSSFFETCLVDSSPPQTCFFFNDAFHHGSSVQPSASKKTKSTPHGNQVTSGSRAKEYDHRFNSQQAQGM